MQLTRYDITELNEGRVPAFPVRGGSGPGWDDISLYYAMALQQMGFNSTATKPYPNAPAPTDPQTDPVQGTPNVANTWNYSESPDSYFFWAAMHWWPGNNWEFWKTVAPAPQDQYWSHCTHGPANVEKYFLPWHRAYIYFYEVIIRAKVAELGGPPEWALPYWNYSFHNPTDSVRPWPRSRLPWVFTQATLPDGSTNPLFLDSTRRGLQPSWPDGSVMYLQTTTPSYTAAYGQAHWLPQTANSGFNQTLDSSPHGLVHDDTGSGDGLISATGWMQFTQTASFDPIFWLHHSQIDRLWVGWNARGGLDPQPADDPNWATAADDTVTGRWNFWAAKDIGNIIVVHPGDMVDPTRLDPAKFPYTYCYDRLPAAPAPKPVPAATISASRSGPGAGAPEVLGLSAATPTQVVHDPVTVAVELHPDAPAHLHALTAGTDAQPGRVVLQLRQIIAGNPPGNYEVYLNNTTVDRTATGRVPEFVGTFGTFGAAHHHGPNAEHVPGIDVAFDITDLVAQQRAQGRWDDTGATVTIVHATPNIPGLTPVAAPISVGSVRIVLAHEPDPRTA